MQNNFTYSTTNYHPFGMTMPGRHFTSENYRFGFNGMEHADDIANGNYTTPFREIDTRLGGRWWSKDPVVKPWESPYAGFSNNPIVFSDPSGLDSEDKTGGGSPSPSDDGKSANNPGELPKDSKNSLPTVTLDEATVTGNKPTQESNPINKVIESAKYSINRNIVKIMNSPPVNTIAAFLAKVNYIANNSGSENTQPFGTGTLGNGLRTNNGSTTAEDKSNFLWDMTKDFYFPKASNTWKPLGPVDIPGYPHPSTVQNLPLNVIKAKKIYDEVDKNRDMAMEKKITIEKDYVINEEEDSVHVAGSGHGYSGKKYGPDDTIGAHIKIFENVILKVNDYEGY